MNAKELIKNLQQVIENDEEGIYGFLEIDSLNSKVLEKEEDEELKNQLKQYYNAVGSFKQVYNERVGSDFDTERTVYHFSDHDIYLAIDGCYSSWDGTDYSYAEWFEVKPEQKTITVYKKS